jgi:N-acyl-phosphatidylethanolamine-hydrolysing phospholipase D
MRGTRESKIKQDHTKIRAYLKISMRSIRSRLCLVFLGLSLNACGPTTRSIASTSQPPHHTESGFKNIYGPSNPHAGLWPYLKMRYIDERFPSPTPATIPVVVTPDVNLIAQPQGDLQVTWIGHSSTLIQVNGKNILTDPIFEERASPLSLFGPKRYSNAGLAQDQLPPVDFVVISHNHFDHLEQATIARLGNTVHWLVPLGLKAWFATQGVNQVTELDWWESVDITGVTFTLTPAQHWSRRGIADTNATLWGGWAIQSGARRIWFAGDTGYSSTLFKEIGQRAGPFDLALVPIGGYGPRDFMREKHADPDDAVLIHQDIQARHSVAIHWGTFVLTAEPIDEPPKRLADARQRHGIDESAFRVLAIGETWMLPVATDGPRIEHTQVSKTSG